MVLGALLSEDRAMSVHGDEPDAVLPDAVLPPATPERVVPPADPGPTVPPVVRRRSTRADDRPSLQPPLLSGRSL